MGYLLHHRLGRGGMGVVDLAVDDHGRPVALKRLAFTGSVTELARARQRVRREAEALRSLHHPAIVPLLDVIDDGEDLILVLPYLAGGSLADRVRAFGPMPPHLVRAMAPLLLDALATAHRAGVVHRDLKPANVLFDEQGRPFIADFGVARLRDATAGLTTSGLLGTPEFMAPEQARGELATPASDVFALGATFGYALTGEGPYGRGDPRVLIHRAARSRLQPLPGTVPTDIRRALQPMLAREPRRRPSAAASVHAWRRRTAPPAPPRPARVAGAPAPTAVAAPGAAAPGVAEPAGARRADLHRAPIRAGRPRRARPRSGALALVPALLALAVVGALVTVAARVDERPPEAMPTTTAPAPTTVPCTPRPYQPCGEPVAPFTDGTRCLDQHADYDGEAANGCEAAPDAADGRRLDRPVAANLVPGDDVDRYPFHADDNFDLFCDGTVRVGLTAPKGATMQLEVLDGTRVLDRATSANGKPATVTLTEPSCFGDDATDLVARVSWSGNGRTAGDYRLEQSGAF